MALNPNIGVGGEQEITSGFVRDIDGRASVLAATGIGPFTSLAAGSSAQAPGTVLDAGIPRAHHALVVVASGAPTAGSVQLQGSHDNVNWANLGAALTIAAVGVQVANVQATPMRYLRANIATAITGGTVAATIASAD